MSYSDPIPATCCLCHEDATDDPDTVAVGKLTAHSACADRRDVYEIERCPYCLRYEMSDDATAWVETSDGLACPTCHAQSVEDHGDPDDVPSPLAGAVRSMAAILREVAS